MQFVRIHRRFPYTALSPIGAHCVPMGLNPYREIVFRSIFQIAGARTVNRLFSPFSDVRKKKGLRIFRRLFHADAQNWFFVVLLRGLLSCASSFLVWHFCCAKVVACGRMTEREWGNPQRFPPHTPPSLRYVEVRTTKPVGSHGKATLKGGFSFWRGR